MFERVTVPSGTDREIATPDVKFRTVPVSDWPEIVRFLSEMLDATPAYDPPGEVWANALIYGFAEIDAGGSAFLIADPAGEFTGILSDYLAAQSERGDYEPTIWGLMNRAEAFRDSLVDALAERQGSGAVTPEDVALVRRYGSDKARDIAFASGGAQRLAVCEAAIRNERR